MGTRLYRAIEDTARALGLRGIFVEASISARPFFARQGFRTLHERTVVRGGAELTNYAMEKLLE